MTYEDEQTEAIPVQLPNGAVVKIETAQGAGREDVAFTMFSFDQSAEILEGVTEAINEVDPIKVRWGQQEDFVDAKFLQDHWSLDLDMGLLAFDEPGSVHPCVLLGKDV